MKAIKQIRNKNVRSKKRSPSYSQDEDTIPILDEKFWSRAFIGSPLKKSLISLRLDNDVIDWFKNEGPNYQTRMNQVLRAYMQFCQHKAVGK
jgi:uncharacterized protein (DUF4415 family)